MYEAAYKIAHDEPTARALADSLYAELYGVNERGEQRTSKLQYYLGRGSLAGWLRTVVAQEYVNQYRRTKRETSLEAALEEGQQFAAAEPEEAPADPRVEAATASELAALRPKSASCWRPTIWTAERWRRSRSCCACMSRRSAASWSALPTGLRKRIRKRLIEAGMSRETGRRGHAGCGCPRPGQ